MNISGFFAELKRRNVYKVAVAYAVVAWLLLQGASIVLPSFEAPSWTMKVLIVALTLGLPVAIILAWAFELTPEGIKREEDVEPNKSIARKTGRKLTGVIIAVTLAAFGLLLFQTLRSTSVIRSAPVTPTAETAPPPSSKSIAVLPFVNMSSDKENEYFVDGLTEEILNRLAQIGELRVPGRTSSFAFKEKNTDLRQIGVALGVAHVLEGSVRKAGDRLRITAQLVRTEDGYHLWSQTYDRKLDDVFAIQEEIASAIAHSLSVQLRVGSDRSARPTHDMAAYNDYLEARALITQRTTDNLSRAINLLEATVERDPSFAKAWAALAQARALGPYFRLGTAKEWLPRAEEAARKALASDDTLAVAHSALADVLRDRFEWLAAEAEYRRALELSPGEAETHNQYAQMLLRVGHVGPALEHANKACELDPLAWVPPGIAAAAHLARNDLQLSRELFDRSVRVRGQRFGFQIAAGLIHALSAGDSDSARALLSEARASGNEWSLPSDAHIIDLMDGALAHARDRSAPTPDLKQALEDARTAGHSVLSTSLAGVAIFVGEKENALDALEFEFQSHGSLSYAVLIWAPVYRPLLNDPRFRELLKGMKMPDYWRAAGWGDYCRAKGADDFECVAP
jgi:TolB-like protein